MLAGTAITATRSIDTMKLHQFMHLIGRWRGVDYQEQQCEGWYYICHDETCIYIVKFLSLFPFHAF